MEKEVKITFNVNGNDIPLRDKAKFLINRDGDYIISFAVGTTKIDNIKLSFKEIEYVEPIK